MITMLVLLNAMFTFFKIVLSFDSILQEGCVMGKLQLYKIELDDIRGVYKPGQNVTGRLIIELDEGITVRGISIYTFTKSG